MNMTTDKHNKQDLTDPLGLRNLDAIEPGYDGWAQIESALREQQAGKRGWRRTGAWLAIAASLLLVLGVSLFITQNDAPPGQPQGGLATINAEPASISSKDDIDALIGLSQSMEEQVARLREETGSMPAESANYIAELEDLIAQVDTGLSMNPDSIDLWGQRVNLLLDLAQVYQQQWRIDYSRIASL
jgi:hypothetical protein